MDLSRFRLPAALRGGVILITLAAWLPGVPVSAQTSQSGVSPSSFQGSLVTDKPTGSVMDLSLDEAIQRGLQHNLGVILQSSQQEAAAGQRLEQLQALLPTVDA